MLLSLTWRASLWVAAGAVLGALLRYAINQIVFSAGYRFPWATLLVNVGGCFFAGILLYYVQRSGQDEIFRLFWMTGFLGALTTFSAFSVESLQLWQYGDYPRLFWNVIANVAGSLLAVIAGFSISKLLS